MFVFMIFEFICKIFIRNPWEQNSDLVTILTGSKIKAEARKVLICFLSLSQGSVSLCLVGIA